MAIIATQILLFVGTLSAIFVAVEAYNRTKAIAKATETTFGSVEEHLKDLANNDIILAEAIDSLIENLNTATDEVSEDEKG